MHHDVCPYCLGLDNPSSVSVFRTRRSAKDIFALPGSAHQLSQRHACLIQHNKSSWPFSHLHVVKSKSRIAIPHPAQGPLTPNEAPTHRRRYYHVILKSMMHEHVPPHPTPLTPNVGQCRLDASCKVITCMNQNIAPHSHPTSPTLSNITTCDLKVYGV